jgi:hypothetical protein
VSFGSKDYAALSKDSYEDRSLEKISNEPVAIGKNKYKIFDTYSNPQIGYQGTAYQCIDANGNPTGNIIVAHRGTEKPLRDPLDAAIDVGMVFTGLNAQALDAEAFTKRVMQQATTWGDLKHQPVEIHVTGHSLGGTLAELTAYKFHLHGETFNAYGAAGLLHGMPEGGSQVINHVRATDVVSAASKHFGEVRVYATAQDIDRLSHAHYYEGSSIIWRDAIRGTSLDAHGIDNFVPDAQGQSVLNPENAARYRAHHAMIDLYRQDVRLARTVASARWEIPKAAYEMGEAAVHDAAQNLGETYKSARAAALDGVHVMEQAAEQWSQQLKHHIQPGARTVSDAYRATRDDLTDLAHELGHSGSWLESKPATPTAPGLLNDPDHPGHTLFQHSLQAVQQLNSERGVTSSERDDRFAGALATAAAAAGLARIDRVTLSRDATFAYAIDEKAMHDLWRRHPWSAEVETVTALDTPLAQSSAQCEHAIRQRQAEELQQQQLMQPVQYRAVSVR